MACKAQVQSIQLASGMVLCYGSGRRRAVQCRRTLLASHLLLASRNASIPTQDRTPVIQSQPQLVTTRRPSASTLLLHTVASFLQDAWLRLADRLAGLHAI